MPLSAPKETRVSLVASALVLPFVKQDDETRCRKRLNLEAGDQLGALTVAGPCSKCFVLADLPRPPQTPLFHPYLRGEDMRHREVEQLAPGHTARAMLKQDNLVLEVVLAPRSWCLFQQTSALVC